MEDKIFKIRTVEMFYIKGLEDLAENEKMLFKDVRRYTKKFSGDGYTDWRIPTYDEFKFVMDYLEHNNFQVYEIVVDCPFWVEHGKDNYGHGTIYSNKNRVFSRRISGEKNFVMFVR